MTAPMPIFVTKGIRRSRELSNLHMADQTHEIKRDYWDVRPDLMERVHLGPIKECSNIVHSDSVCSMNVLVSAERTKVGGKLTSLLS